MRRTILPTAAVVAAVVGLPGVASAETTTSYVVPLDLTVVASPNTCPNPLLTDFCGYTRGTGTVGIAPGAPDAASGTDHLVISTPDGNAKAYALSYEFAGTPLSDIETLGYRSYVAQVNPAEPRQAPALNIEVDRNGGTLQPGDYAVLVWEPVYTAESTDARRWITRSPSTSDGGWWSPANRSTTQLPQPLGFPQEEATWEQVQAGLQNATVLGIGVNQGGGNPGLLAQVDLLQVNGTVHDFETELPYPTAKEQCRKNGWAEFTAPGFRNQGQCVSWVARRSGDA
ncbi:hypothetical protein SAMN05660209_00964 [Geodermatophilus africanus]|uniref:Secreted protein n=1 Tax=Geodermatophilus africanus TaxID=1137993 RepID=A0A1H3DFF2_9ACTN|nr:hypothetical protein [Geodermatophilus africanus]SDX64878.1 hypothetical protein SAMN05660209_00964 [Geodermatophilus africanus]